MITAMVSVRYTRKTITFDDYLWGSKGRRRRMPFDVARTPALDCLYDPDGASRLHALILEGEPVPIHPWESPAMTAFRAAVATTVPPPLEATMVFHAQFRVALRGIDCLDLEGMARSNADKQLEHTVYAILEQDPRLPRFSVKVGEWLGSVAHKLEDCHWGFNSIKSQAPELRRLVLKGGHVGASCVRLCRYHGRHYVQSILYESDDDKGELFFSTVAEALAERPRQNWAKARTGVVVPMAIVSFWRHVAAAPDSRAAKAAIARARAGVVR